MEEARRNFLTYEIISGLKFIIINDIRYKLVPPSKELNLLAEHVYQETVNSLRFDNLITKEKAKLFLLRLGLWGPKEDENLEKQEKYLDDKKVDLFHAMYDLSKQDRTRKTIEGIKKAINNSYGRKHSLDYMTLDYHAALTKKKFIIAMRLRDNENKAIYTEEDFWNADSTILENVVDVLDRDILSVEEFRELARNDPWRTIWNLGKESCMGTCSAEWTDNQRTLVSFTKMYDNAYQSMECPSDDVIKDDDMFDGWMIDQKRKREKETKQRQVDTMNKIPDKAQEVFVFAPTREDANKVYDMNDMEARMTVKQREQQIVKRKGQGRIDATQLLDTQMELRNQQMQEYKDKMHRGR